MGVRWKTKFASPSRGDDDSGGTSRLCVSVASSVGIGVFLIVGYVAKHVAGPATLVSIVIAALIAALSALFNIELSQRLPRKASPYTFSHVCLGRFASFLTGWTLILEYAVAFAVVAKGVGLYIDTLIDDAMQTAFVAVAPLGGGGEVIGTYFDFFGAVLSLFVGSVFIFNLQRRRWVDTGALIVCVAVVIFIITAGSFNANPVNWTANIDGDDAGGAAVDSDGGFFPFGVMATFRGAALCTFAFIGIEMLMRSNRDTQRSVSYIGMLSFTMIFLSMLGCSVVLTLMWPHYHMHVNVPFPYAFAAYNFNLAKWIVSIAAIVILSTSLWTLMFPLKRQIHTLAEDGLLPFADHNRRAMGATLLTVVTIASLFAGLFSMGQLIDLLSVGTLLMFIVVAVAIVMLRYSHQLEIGSISTIDVAELRAVDFASPRLPAGTPQPFIFPFSLGSNARNNNHNHNGLTSPGIDRIPGHRKSTVRMWLLQIVGRATDDDDNAGGATSGMTGGPRWVSSSAAHSNGGDAFAVRRPTRRSYLVVKCALVVQLCAMVGAALTVRYAEDNIYNADVWAVTVLVLFGLIVCAGITVTASQPQRINRNFYRVPLVAGTAGCTLFACVLLVCMLDYTAWARLLVWLCLGVPVFVVARRRRRRSRLWRNVSGISKIQGMHNRGFSIAEKPPAALAVQHGAQMVEITEADETAEQMDVYVEPTSVKSISATDHDGNNNINNVDQPQMKGQLASRTPSPSSSFDDIVLASDIIESLSERREPNGKTYFVNDVNGPESVVMVRSAAPCSAGTASRIDNQELVEPRFVGDTQPATFDDYATITMTSTVVMVHTLGWDDPETVENAKPQPVTVPDQTNEDEKHPTNAADASNFEYGSHLQSLDSESSDGGEPMTKGKLFIHDSNSDSGEEEEEAEDTVEGIDEAFVASNEPSPSSDVVINTPDTGATLNDFKERLSMLLVGQSRTLTRQTSAHVHTLDAIATASGSNTTSPLMESSDSLALHRHPSDRFTVTDVEKPATQVIDLTPTDSNTAIPPPPIFHAGLYNGGNMTRIPTPDYKDNSSVVIISDDDVSVHVAMQQQQQLYQTAVEPDTKKNDTSGDNSSSGDEPTAEDMKSSIRAKLENILLRGPPVRVSTDRYGHSALSDRVSTAVDVGSTVAVDPMSERMDEAETATTTPEVVRVAENGPAQQDDHKVNATDAAAKTALDEEQQPQAQVVRPSAAAESIQRQTMHRALFKDVLKSITIDGSRAAASTVSSSSVVKPMRHALSAKPATIEDARKSLRHVESTIL